MPKGRHDEPYRNPGARAQNDSDKDTQGGAVAARREGFFVDGLAGHWFRRAVQALVLTGQSPGERLRCRRASHTKLIVRVILWFGPSHLWFTLPC